MPTPTPEKLEFVLRKHGLVARVWTGLAAQFHYFFRTASHPRFSFRGGARVVVSAISVAGLTLVPFWFTNYISPSSTLNVSMSSLIGVSCLIVVLMMSRGIATWDRRSSRRGSESRRFTVNFADNMGHFRKAFRGHDLDPASESAREAIKGVLRTIADRVRMLEPESLKEPDSLEAILVLFDDDECEGVVVAARSHPTRRPGMKLKACDSISYYVAMKGTHHVENRWDQASTPFRDTQLSAGDFRSFLFVPLMEYHNGTYRVPGVIAIASTRPYLFARRAEDVRLKIDPCCTLLKTLIQNHTAWIEVKAAQNG